MPRYHFNVLGTPHGRDNEGSELPDGKAARAEALTLMGEILRETARKDAFSDELHVEVTNAAGMIVFRLDFTIVASAARPEPLASA